MATDGAKVAIVGAGIGGLAAAAALRKVGIGAQIYEQTPALAAVGAGIQLTPNATKAIRGFSLLEAVKRRSYAPSIGYNREWNTGAITNELQMGHVIEETFGAPDLAMQRYVLHDALLSCVPAECIQLGKRLVGLDRTSDRIRLRFADGSDVLADAVIGADGIHSVVRQTLFGEIPLCFTGRVAYRTTFSTSRIPSDVEIDGRVKWWGPDRHIVSYLLTPQEDEIYFIAATPDPDFTLESWSTLGSTDELLAAFDGFHPRILSVLSAADRVRKWALVDRDPMDIWGEERIVLLGDACHPMPPYIAQGAAAAMEDAIVLARCLDGVDRDGIADAFRQYEEVRRPRTSRMQITARHNTWMRYKTDAEWVYGYDAWTTPLSASPEIASA